MPTRDVYLTAAVEGSVDEAVVRAMAAKVGFQVRAVYVTNGKDALRQRLAAYNNAAQYAPWLVVTDLDDEECAPPLKSRLLAKPAPKMCFRIAVREVESWLLGDPERVASFFAVPLGRIPIHPEREADPKQTLVNLVRHSTKRAIREDMIPREGSGRSVGPAYASRLIEFVTNCRSGWRCRVAARRADSLRRCLACLERLRKATRSRAKKRSASGNR